MPIEILPLLAKVTPGLLVQVGKATLTSLLNHPPVLKALDATASSFEHIEDIRGKLARYCQSTQFEKLLGRLKSGVRHEETEKAVVSSFVEATELFHGEDTEILASQILAALARNLVESLFATDEGLTVLANRMEQLQVESQDHVEEVVGHGNQIVLRELASLKEIVSRKLPGETEITKDKVVNSRIDVARDLLKQGKAEAAKLLLLQIRQEIDGQDVSIETRFRIATNLGACALELQDNSTMQLEFKRALDLQPNSVKALSNAAVVEMYRKDYAIALKLVEKARLIECTDSHATSVYIELLHKLGRVEEIDRLLSAESWITEDASCLLVFGGVSLERGNYSQAEACARKCLEKEESPQGHMLLGEALALPIQKSFQEDPPLPWRIDDNLKKRLEEAEEEFTSAILILDGHDSRSRLYDAFTNRSSVRALLGKAKEALQDCDRVLVENPGDLIALKNKGLTLLEQRRFAESIECLSRVFSQQKDIGLAMSLAYALLESDREPDVLVTLLPLWNRESKDRRHLRVAHLIIQAAFKSGRTDQVEEVAHAIAEFWPDDPEALSILADRQRREGKAKEAIDLLFKALGTAAVRQRDFIVIDIADLYAAEGSFHKAAEYYAVVVDKSKDNPLLRKYLIALFNSGLYLDVLQLAQGVRGSGKAIPMVSELEARVLDYVGAYDQARTLCDQLAQAEPKKISHRIRVAILDLRNDDRDSCKHTIEAIRFEEIKDHSLALMQVAEIRAILGLPGVLPLAYRARNLAFGDPNMHLAYMRLFLNRGKYEQEVLDPSEVVLDSTVFLKDGDATKIFTIVEERIGGEGREILLSNSLAKALLGKRVGERVVLRSGIEDLSYDVIKIQSKYVHAFQETLSEFSTLFPDNRQLFRVKIADNDFTKVLSSLDSRQTWVSQVMMYYRDHHLTLGAFAELVGRSLITVWSGMVTREDGRVLASTGQVELMQEETDLLKNNRSIVIELTPLLLFGSLDLLDPLPRLFDSIYVPQAVLDEIVEELRSLEMVQPAMTMWKEGDQYIKHEITSSEIDRDRKFLEKLKTFVKASTQLVPMSEALKVGKDKFESLNKLLGESSFASVLTAKQQDSLLLSDQFGLRQIALNDWKVKSVWSQSVLSAMRDSRVISEEAYHKAVLKLILGHYHFVSIGADTLMWILKENGMGPTPEVLRVFGAFQGPDCTEESAIRVLSDLLKRVWLETLLEDHKLWTLDLVLKSLVTGRNGQRVIAMLKDAMRERLSLMPLDLPRVIQNIDIWKKFNPQII